eukprot:CAMPEP_0177789886 /NCGR_PEP_ID=MMETSP0491_2-20121128/23026_1 /TAXON_ID=63592 /ORGANISM="Tetraselmis chuii, Strain PLY429" /LENGTH=101 /DNA_ID=CAMNT_0019311855 /DNA_START=620 /DNA_END=926 /DNA_ORIENTATION=-
MPCTSFSNATWRGEPFMSVPMGSLSISVSNILNFSTMSTKKADISSNTPVTLSFFMISGMVFVLGSPTQSTSMPGSSCALAVVTAHPAAIMHQQLICDFAP